MGNPSFNTDVDGRDIKFINYFYMTRKNPSREGLEPAKTNRLPAQVGRALRNHSREPRDESESCTFMNFLRFLSFKGLARRLKKQKIL